MIENNKPPVQSVTALERVIGQISERISDLDIKMRAAHRTFRGYVMTRRLARPLVHLVLLERQAWWGLRGELLKLQEGGEADSFAIARAAWHLRLDELIVLEAKLLLLEKVADRFGCYLKSPSVVFAYERYVVPILNRGWTFGFEEAKSRITLFRKAFEGDEIIASLKKERRDELVNKIAPALLDKDEGRAYAYWNGMIRWMNSQNNK